jgi:hypothetical protein
MMMTSPCSMKKSDSSSEDGCSSCFINLLHLRSHGVDAVVDGNTTMIDDAAGMMGDDVMIDDADDANINEENDGDDDDDDDNNNNDKTNKKPPAASGWHKKNIPTRGPRYSSPSPEDVTSEKPSSTTPPPLPRKRGDNTFNNQRSLSTDSISSELHSAASLSIPALTRSPPESIPQSHLIITTNDDNDAPMLSLNSLNNTVNPNEADDDMIIMPQIPRIHLQMRHSNPLITSTSHRRVIEANPYHLPPTIEQTMETRQAEGGFVPIQQDSREEDSYDDDDDDDDDDAEM